jgi:hypothetical protein
MDQSDCNIREKKGANFNVILKVWQLKRNKKCMFTPQTMRETTWKWISSLTSQRPSWQLDTGTVWRHSLSLCIWQTTQWRIVEWNNFKMAASDHMIGRTTRWRGTGVCVRIGVPDAPNGGVAYSWVSSILTIYVHSNLIPTQFPLQYYDSTCFMKTVLISDLDKCWAVSHVFWNGRNSSRSFRKTGAQYLSYLLKL